jgi:hypothetical protein
MGTRFGVAAGDLIHGWPISTTLKASQQSCPEADLTGNLLFPSPMFFMIFIFIPSSARSVVVPVSNRGLSNMYDCVASADVLPALPDSDTGQRKNKGDS